METRVPDFGSQAERTQWIIDHADYFSLVRRAERRYFRVEVPTLDIAVTQALALTKKHPTARILIYAVHGPVDTYVATVSKDGVHTGAKHEKPWRKSS